MLWVMLNPSTADGTKDDPTIRKCIGFATRHGCEAIEVVNLFALRATNPRELVGARDPVGPDNPRVLRDVRYAADAAMIVAWGGATRARALTEQRARRFERELGHLPFSCFGTTERGQPRHPLMLAYATPLQGWPR